MSASRSRFLSIIKKLERELNETHNLKRRFPEFPLDIRFPAWVPRNGWGVFYQKKRGFTIWGPNHYTRASLVTAIAPNTGEVNPDPPIRTSGYSFKAGVTWWNIRVGNGTGATQKQDTALKATTTYQADSGMSARVDVPSPAAYQRQYSAVYNANTLPSGYTITEVGLYMTAMYTETISGQNFTDGTEYMIARLSTSDGDFTAYTVNNTLPLTINWIIQWSL